MLSRPILYVAPIREREVVLRNSARVDSRLSVLWLWLKADFDARLHVHDNLDWCTSPLNNIKSVVDASWMRLPQRGRKVCVFG